MHNVMMTVCLGFCLMLAGLMGSARGAEVEKRTYYIQLVRGTDTEGPPEPGNKQIGPKLGAKFHSILRYKNYWEVARKEVEVKVGTKVKVTLNPQRAVEIDLTQAGKRRVTVLRDGKPMPTETHPIGQVMTIVGGDRDAATAWFVVVRLDKPTVE